MEQRAFAREPGSLGGGGGISEKSLVSISDVVMSALELFRLWVEPLLDDGCDGGCWTFCLEPERGSSATAAGLDEGPSSTQQEIDKLI